MGIPGPGGDLPWIALLDQLTVLQYVQPVSDGGSQGKVVGDEEEAEPLFLHEILQGGDDPLLGDNVQGRGGLVAEKIARRAGKGQGYGRPLFLPSREFVGIPPGQFPVQTCQGKEGQDAVQPNPSATARGAPRAPPPRGGPR